jgi:hypothetical protein
MIKYFVSVFAVILLPLFFLAATLKHSGVVGADNPETQTSMVQNEGDESFNQEQAMADLRARIADQKTKPAGEVFENIQLLKDVPAGALLSIMEIGYSKSLGVTCTHCHIANHWESDDKRNKLIARDMVVMMRQINNDLLKKIKNLESENPVVNCTTCHRGQTKPALDLP